MPCGRLLQISLLLIILAVVYYADLPVEVTRAVFQVVASPVASPALLTSMATRAASAKAPAAPLRRCNVTEAAAERRITQSLWGGQAFTGDTTQKADIGSSSYLSSLRRATTEACLPALPHAPLVLNVGANTGELAMHVLDALRNATVHSFEPFPATFAQLEAARAAAPPADASRWILHNLGCGDTNNPSVTMWGVPGDEGSHAGESRGEEHMARFASWNSSTAPFVRLGDWMETQWREGRLAPEIDLVQIDAEGFDGPVLAGLDWARHAARVAMVAFETGAAWLWKSHNPKGYKFADVLQEAQDLGYECFFIGREDLWRITPWFAPAGSPIATDIHHPKRMEKGTNVLCVRNDTVYLPTLLSMHSVHVRHALCAGPLLTTGPLFEVTGKPSRLRRRRREPEFTGMSTPSRSRQ